MRKGRKALLMAGVTASLAICSGLLSNTMAAEHNPVEQGYMELDFEDDYQPFNGRSGRVWTLTTEGNDPNRVLLIAGRDASWDGPTMDVTDWLVPGKEYAFSAYIKQTGNENEKINISCELHAGDKLEYRGLRDGVVLPAKVWKKVEFNFIAPTGQDSIQIYMQSGEDRVFDFMLDEVSIKPSIGESWYASMLKTYSLKEVYKDDFRVGMSFLIDEMRNEDFREVLSYQFNSGTYGNEFKPDYMLNQEACKLSSDGSPEIYYDRIDEFLTIAQETGVPMRGHVLVWHSQTPDWFFKVGYDDNADYVDRATMSFRMEQYIRKMLQYTQTKFPGVIYAWDVVNEAADDGGGYRKQNSGWYTVMGEGFIEEAFRYARKYADPSIKLFYNDYNEYLPAKRATIFEWITDLQSKGLIDGMGMQSHVDLKNTAVSDYLETVRLYGSTGLEVQVTELDIHNPDKGVAGNLKLADKYEAIFRGLRTLKRSGTNISAVTIWGISDDISWLTNNQREKSYPLLFDENGQPKEAFHAVVEVVIPGVRDEFKAKWN